jgi:DNA (cytosine-5)-methyltransferase 1
MNEIVELFCGASGLGLGAELAGFRLAVAADVDQTLTSSHLENFPQCALRLGDLSHASKQSLLQGSIDGRKRVTGVIGGPPCQGFSTMGRHNANDPRRALLDQYFRLVAEIRPKFFLMENVPGLLSPRNAELLDSAISRVPSKYKIVGPVILDAAKFGAATRRLRTVVLGYDPDELDAITLDDMAPIANCVSTVADAIMDLPDPSNARPDGLGEYWAAYARNNRQLSAYALAARKMPPTHLGAKRAREALSVGRVSGLKPTEHTEEVIARFSQLRQGEVDEISRALRLDKKGLCPTLRAGTGSDKGSFQAVRPIHPTKARAISVREAARLQGFPDWFMFHPTVWHSCRMIGNSVSPIFAHRVLEMVAKKIDGGCLNFCV